MKNLILILIFIITTSITYGAVNQAVTGDWSSPSTWSLGHVPLAGEIVIIPSGKTVTITTVENYAGTLNVDIYGSLILNGGSLYLGNASIISIYAGGKVLGMGNNTELIKIGGVQKYSGNGQTPVFGPQMASSSTGGGFMPFIPLPVQFVSFSLSVNNSGVLVQWATAQEQNASYYDIERSIDGSKWNSIAHVSAIGNTSHLSSYSYTDKNIIADLLYYRIKQVDNNGQFVYTAIKNIRTGNNNNAGIQIWTSNNSMILQFPQQVNGSVLVRLVSFSGQVVNQQTLNQPVGQVVLNNNLSLKGNFIVSVTNAKDINVTKLVQLN